MSSYVSNEQARSEFFATMDPRRNNLNMNCDWDLSRGPNSGQKLDDTAYEYFCVHVKQIQPQNIGVEIDLDKNRVTVRGMHSNSNSPANLNKVKAHYYIDHRSDMANAKIIYSHGVVYCLSTVNKERFKNFIELEVTLKKKIVRNIADEVSNKVNKSRGEVDRVHGDKLASKPSNAYRKQSDGHIWTGLNFASIRNISNVSSDHTTLRKNNSKGCTSQLADGKSKANEGLAGWDKPANLGEISPSQVPKHGLNKNKFYQIQGVKPIRSNPQNLLSSANLSGKTSIEEASLSTVSSTNLPTSVLSVKATTEDHLNTAFYDKHDLASGGNSFMSAATSAQPKLIRKRSKSMADLSKGSTSDKLRNVALHSRWNTAESMENLWTQTKKAVGLVDKIPSYGPAKWRSVMHGTVAAPKGILRHAGNTSIDGSHVTGIVESYNAASPKVARNVNVNSTTDPSPFLPPHPPSPLNLKRQAQNANDKFSNDPFLAEFCQRKGLNISRITRVRDETTSHRITETRV